MINDHLTAVILYRCDWCGIGVKTEMDRVENNFKTQKDNGKGTHANYFIS